MPVATTKSMQQMQVDMFIALNRPIWPSLTKLQTGFDFMGRGEARRKCRFFTNFFKGK
jgi:hypothetical protein